jgi:ethanolamine utilization protein EutQ (cupin superfamily)
MKRLKDWRTRLHEAVEARRRVPFSFETGADCALFAADCVDAMTGEDMAAGYRGKYRSQAGAIRAIRKAGFDDLASLVGSKLDETSTVRARVGDVAFIPDESPFGGALGIVIGEQIAVMHVDGIGSVPRTAMIRAFRIP